MTSSPSSPRLLAVDALRGLVMVLMVIDHAMAAFDPNHFVTDSVALWQPGSALPAGPFLIRWITHFCAPVFVFLAGASLALGRARHPRRPEGFLFGRGLLIAAIDPLLLTFVWGYITPIGPLWLFQVLFAIGASMAIAVLLRRFPLAVRVGLGVSYLVFQDAILFALLDPAPGSLPGGPVAFLMSGGVVAQRCLVVYPVLPWLAVLLVGEGLGAALARAGRETECLERRLMAAGVTLLAMFFLLRFVNHGYGNTGLLRDDASWLQWLHCSKYPPSMSFLAMTLGPALLVLGWWMRWERLGGSWRPKVLGVLAVYGRAALVFYLLHALILAGMNAWLGLPRGVMTGWAVFAGLVVALYPVCVLWPRLKRADPSGVLRLF